MIRIYTKLDNKLAYWDVDSNDRSQIPDLISDLIKTVLPKGHRTGIFTVVPKPELIIKLNETI